MISDFIQNTFINTEDSDVYKTDSFCPQSLDYKYMDRIISDIGED